MSSSDTSLDWVLSHWAHFTVPRFFCVYVCFLSSCRTAYVLYYCNTVVWTWWDWSLIFRTLSSFSALTLLFGSFDPWKPVPDMTDVFDGTLNLTQLQVLLSHWTHTLVTSKSVMYHQYVIFPAIEHQRLCKQWATRSHTILFVVVEV